MSTMIGDEEDAIDDEDKSSERGSSYEKSDIESNSDNSVDSGERYNQDVDSSMDPSLLDTTFEKVKLPEWIVYEPDSGRIELPEYTAYKKQKKKEQPI